MNCWRFFVLSVTFYFTLVNSASIVDDTEIEEQGLYSKSDHVILLTGRNFERKIYGQRYPIVVQFYNSYCGHCRAFAPKFKGLASELLPWANILKLAVIDCAVEENNEMCRQFDVLSYPSLRYLHENFVKGNTYVGDKIQVTEGTDKLKANLISKLQTEQSMGRLLEMPSLSISSYSSFAAALDNVPSKTFYTFLVFENENSTVGSELTLDLFDYQRVRVKRVYETSELTDLAGVTHFPGLVAVSRVLEATPLTPKTPTIKNLLKSVNTFLKSKNYEFPIRDFDQGREREIFDVTDNKVNILNSDIVYYSDLEKTIRTSLHTEVPRHKNLKEEPLQALINYLEVLIYSFPFKKQLKAYITDLHDTLSTRTEWSGNQVYDMVKRLEIVHAPVYTTDVDYIGCKGSQAQYRGYTCGLWTLFHTLTVNAALQPGVEGPRVLKAMHGYIKNFFGCTECVEHFTAMAAKNRIFDVKENDKAVLWLWISHNEVNLRLAGSITEDPEHPKIQFPSISRCPECKIARGAWNLPAVYQYLQKVYGPENIQDARNAPSSVTASPFSNLDLGMLSLLYMTT